MTNPTDSIINDAEKFVDGLSDKNVQSEYERTADNGDDKIMYIKTPNFTDCGSGDTQLPINLANETITVLSRYRAEFDFVDFIKEKLNYNSRVAVCMAFFSEQIDALVLAIKQFEDNKALILGDMAGIGKGRVVAGVLRYAYQKGLTPIFVTEKENLFSDMWLDIRNIGGFGGSGGNIIEARPFIMTPYTKDRKGSIVDKENYEIDTTQPLGNSELNKIIAEANGKFPFKREGKEYDFNCIFLTYNVISKTRGVTGDAKRYWLLEVSQNGIIIMDECHNASGRSKLGEWAKQYVTQAKGVMFSSATYAKNPQAFPLYIIKTAMSEAGIDIATIDKAIGAGGENVSEYISSVLVKEGQMIRRERSFDGCTVGTIYDGSDLSKKDADKRKEEIYAKFNGAVSKFRNIYEYIRQRDFKDAIKSAIMRKASELDIELAPQDEFYAAKKGTSQAANERRANFIRDYYGSYIIAKFDSNTLGPTTKFHFTENLLLSVKSKFLADSIIKELQTEAEYSYFDGKKKKSNRKPVIAIRATGETLFDKLNIKTGDIVQNDFSDYIKSVVSGVLEGGVVFRKVDNNVFTPAYEMTADGLVYEQEIEQYQVMLSDLSDGGTVLNRYTQEANSYVSGMPLSVIDYLIDRIQSQPRKSWDRFGSIRQNYVVQEVTGRNYALKNKGDGQWEFVKNDRIKSVNEQFGNFNKGEADVLIINASGSTGGSIHSSESFKDQRPRIMFLGQIELDVNTEVQKRGRTNRSGQVTYPAYLYVLSQVPGEIRKFLSLKRKLRRLDANVAANQTQNSNMVAIKDKVGEPIEDIFNIYGEEAFQRLINDSDNILFRDVYDSMTRNWANDVFSDEYVSEGNVTQDVLTPYTRELEIYDCKVQEDFYDAMNVIYKTVVNEHDQAGTYQLELDTEDLRASVRTRVVRQMNNGKTEFSKPLFVEDKYCLERKRLWSKEKVDSEITRMAKRFYEERDDSYASITKFHNDLLEDFEVRFDGFINAQLDQYRITKEPQREDYSNEEDYNEELTKYNSSVTDLQARYDDEMRSIRLLIQWYIPGRNVVMLEAVSSSQDGATATNIERRGKFIGYSFKSTSIRNKYSKGSIHFKFAFLAGAMPSMEISMSQPAMLNLLKETKTHSERVFSNRIVIGGKSMGERDGEKINAWEVNPNTRKINRFLSGNILSGIQLANNMEDIKRWSLVRYSNEDGTISTGVRLDYPEDKFKPLTRTPLAGETAQVNSTISVSLDNTQIIEYLRLTPIDYIFNVTVNTYGSTNVEPFNVKAKEFLVAGLIRIFKNKNDGNRMMVEIFQGQPSLREMKNPANRINVENNVPFKNGSNVNNPIYFAPFLDEYDIFSERKYDRRGTGYRLENPNYKSPDGYKIVSGNSKVYTFPNIDTEDGGAKLVGFLSGIYNEQPIVLEFPQNINDYYSVAYAADVYQSDTERAKEKDTVSVFETGDYKYKLEVDYDTKYAASPPPGLKSYEKGKNSFDNGYLILSQPISPAFAKAYGIYPVEFSAENTIRLLMSIFSQDDLAEFNKQLSDKIEQGSSFSQIGDFVSAYVRRRSVPDLKYVFGPMRTNDIGELLKTYSEKGDLTRIQIQVAEDQEDEGLFVSPKKTAITVDDAEKFINYLLF
jgi:hypothetical protein